MTGEWNERRREPAIQAAIDTLLGAQIVAMHMAVDEFDEFDWTGLHRALVFAVNTLRTLAESDTEHLGRVLAARNCRYLGDNTFHAAWCDVFDFHEDSSGRFAGKACTCGAITD